MLAPLRILAGLVAVGGVIAFGVWQYAPLIIVPLALVFTVAFGLGRWRAWKLAAETGTLTKAITAQAGTLVIQGVLVGILYLIGRGIAAMAGYDTGTQAIDWALIGVFGIIVIGLGVVIAVLEAPGQPAAEQFALAPDSSDGPVIDPTPLTDQTFWSSHHYSNSDNVYDDTKETALNPGRAYLSEEQITAEEARLGITLPPRLRRLYGLQNGGSGMDLWVPCDADIPNSDGGWLGVFSGYNDCTPLTKMNHLREDIEAYADFEDQPEMFPKGADRLFPLARWYTETLFLDYRAGDTPRVGFCDLDEDDLDQGHWEDRAVWWDDFEAFFSDLRRGSY